jgi:hypothetical protein
MLRLPGQVFPVPLAHVRNGISEAIENSAHHFARTALAASIEAFSSYMAASELAKEHNRGVALRDGRDDVNAANCFKLCADLGNA